MWHVFIFVYPSKETKFEACATPSKEGQRGSHLNGRTLHVLVNGFFGLVYAEFMNTVYD